MTDFMITYSFILMCFFAFFVFFFEHTGAVFSNIKKLLIFIFVTYEVYFTKFTLRNLFWPQFRIFLFSKNLLEFVANKFRTSTL